MLIDSPSLIQCFYQQSKQSSFTVPSLLVKVTSRCFLKTATVAVSTAKYLCMQEQLSTNNSNEMLRTQGAGKQIACIIDYNMKTALCCNRSKSKKIGALNQNCPRPIRHDRKTLIVKEKANNVCHSEIDSKCIQGTATVCRPSTSTIKIGVQKKVAYHTHIFVIGHVSFIAFLDATLKIILI